MTLQEAYERLEREGLTLTINPDITPYFPLTLWRSSTFGESVQFKTAQEAEAWILGDTMIRDGIRLAEIDLSIARHQRDMDLKRNELEKLQRVRKQLSYPVHSPQAPPSAQPEE